MICLKYTNMKNVRFHISIIVFALIIIVVLFSCKKENRISSRKQAITGVWACKEFSIDSVDALQQYKDSTGDFKFVFEKYRIPDDSRYYFYTYLYNDSIYLDYIEHYRDVRIGRNYTKLYLSFAKTYYFRDNSGKTSDKPIGIGPLANGQYTYWEIHTLIYKELLIISTFHNSKHYLIKLIYLKEIENEPNL